MFFSKTNLRRHVCMYICYTLYFSLIANQYDNITTALQPKNFDYASDTKNHKATLTTYEQVF